MTGFLPDITFGSSYRLHVLDVVASLHIFRGNVKPFSEREKIQNRVYLPFYVRKLQITMLFGPHCDKADNILSF